MHKKKGEHFLKSLLTWIKNAGFLVTYLVAKDIFLEHVLKDTLPLFSIIIDTVDIVETVIEVI